MRDGPCIHTFPINHDPVRPWRSTLIYTTFQNWKLVVRSSDAVERKVFVVIIFLGVFAATSVGAFGDIGAGCGDSGLDLRGRVLVFGAAGAAVCGRLGVAWLKGSDRC